MIELNNSSHYKYIDGEEHLNLKSLFRQRVIEMEGYQYVNVRVEDYIHTETMFQDIQKII